MSREEDVFRSWGGLEVALVTTPAGATRARASSNHRLGFHAGVPVRASCRYDGRAHQRIQSRGDIDLVPAGVDGVWEDDRPTRILRMSVSRALLASAAAGLDVDVARVDLAPQYQIRDPRLEHVAWAFEAELASSEPTDPLYGESLAMALATHLVRRYRTTARAAAEPRGGLSKRALTRVIEHIEASLDGRLSLEELARVAGVSASHFKVLFKRSTGSPVHRYVVQRRVERARLLLLDGRATITDIALRTGFSDASHMARCMRRVSGVTPAALLRSR